MAIAPPSPPRREPSSVPVYWIVVPITGSPEMAIDTVRSVLEGAAHPERLRLMGTAEDVAAVSGACPPGPRGLGESYLTADRPTLESAIGLLLEPSLATDLLVVSPGIRVPALFDLRLCWSAESEPPIGGPPGIVAVSPLCDVDPVTSPARYGLEPGTSSLSLLDREAAAAGSRPIVDAPWFLPECFYLVAAAARETLRGLGGEGVKEIVSAFRRRGLVMALAPHLVVESRLPPRGEPWLDDVPARALLGRSRGGTATPRALARPRRAIGQEPPSIERRTRPRVLHVTHSLGGGLGRWMELFFEGARANEGAGGCDGYILRSIGERGRFGSQLWLYDDPDATQPIEVWKLAAPIEATAARHLGYREVLDALVRDYGISAVAVSSLIGHSLDVFATGLPTALVCHDYYPACPALHIHFGEVCRSCEPERLAACFAENPLNDLFAERDPRQWLSLRAALFDLLRRGEVRMVAPSPSVARHYKEIFPELAAVELAIVPHGIEHGLSQRVAASADDAACTGSSDATAVAAGGPPDGSTRKLRVVVPGRLSAAKGADLFRSVLDHAGDFVELHLIGCGEGWEGLRSRGVEVMPHYEPGRLPELLAQRRPDLALLLSIVPETWSLTLEECFAAGVPVVATRVGSFADRIEEGSNGFLCEPDAPAIVARLASLHADPTPLRAVRERLVRQTRRRASEMVADYARLLELPRHSRRSYFASAPGAGGRLLGVRLPPSSPLGFMDFLRQVEAGTYHHLDVSPRLGPWSRRLATTAARSGFRLLRWAARRL